MVQTSEPYKTRTPFEIRPKSTIRKPDMSGCQIPTVIEWSTRIFANLQIIKGASYHELNLLFYCKLYLNTIIVYNDLSLFIKCCAFIDWA